MSKWNLATGLRVSMVHTPEEKAKGRLARLRVAVWAGINGLAAMKDSGEYRLIMFTLTYRGIKDWAPRSIRRFVRWLHKVGVGGYVWVAELQKRGAVHYHLLAAWPAKMAWIKPSADNGAWVKGFTWVTDNVRKPYYLMKYIQKGTKDGRAIRYPKGIRIYAISRGAVAQMSSEVRDVYRAIHLPYWYREGAGASGRLGGSRRVVGGIARGAYTYLSPYAERVPSVTDATVAAMWYNFSSSP